jgi:copper homeostasis protein
MNQIALEICSFSYEGCLNATLGGADRIELCSSPGEGGTTPSYGLTKLVKDTLDISVYPIIRPRGGNFVYTNDEFRTMINDIVAFKSLGCSGIAVGVQKPDGNIDIEKLGQLVDIAWPMRVTFIRAFELVPDMFRALDDLITCRCERVLTSGQVPFASDALPIIKQLVDYAGNKISIMAGSGIRPENVEQIIKETNVREVHTSTRKKDDHTFGPETAKFDFGYGVTCDLDQIKKIRQAIDKLSLTC